MINKPFRIDKLHKYIVSYTFKLKYITIVKIRFNCMKNAIKLHNNAILYFQ